MSDIPHIFDDQLRRRRREKVAGQLASTDFLLKPISIELSERLQAIHREFQTFVCHGAGHLSQMIASGCIATDTTQNSSQVGQIVLDEAALPFAPAAIDAFASVLTLHALNDLPGALAQIRHALRPDGLFIAALFGGDTLVELRKSFADAELEIDGGVSPRVFPFADLRDAGALLQRAGFALPVADSEKLVVHYESPIRLLHDLRHMAESNVLFDRRRTFLRRSVLFRTLEIYAANYADSTGRVRATFEVLYLTGWAPHESQQKPLQPGSGKVSLADILKKPSAD